MVYIIVTTCFPTHKGNEAARKYIEQLKKYPEDDSLGESVLDLAVKATTDGIKAISISEAKKGKLEESLTRTNNILAMYNEIEGYEYTVEIWLSPAEALATIGMKMPK